MEDLRPNFFFIIIGRFHCVQCIFIYVVCYPHAQILKKSSLKCFKIVRLKFDVETIAKAQNLSFQKFPHSILQIPINPSLQPVISICLNHKYSPQLNDCTQ